MPERKKRTFISMVWEACQDSVIIILALCAVVSLALGIAFPESFYDDVCDCIVKSSTDWVEGVAIIVAILVVVFVGAGQDYDKERKFRALGKCDIRKIKVVRGGETVEIDANTVLVGDVVILDWGKFVPADGYCIASDGMRVDEASVTGEAEPVAKGPKDPWLMANTSVTSGSGKMLVGAVGASTEWGITLMGLQEAETEDTPLQQDLESMVVAIGVLGLVMGVAVFYILAIYWAVDVGTLMETTAWQNEYIRPIVDALIIGITLLVVGIPEGLPLAVIISLAYSGKKMAEENNLVRHLQACETMGGATNICSDKTGTLTQNKMTVMEAWIGGKIVSNEPQGWKPGSEQYWHILKVGISLNSTALRQVIEVDGKPTNETKVVGYPTEMALLDHCEKIAGSTDSYKAERLAWEPNKVVTIPFSSETKRMTSVYYIPELDVLRVFCKGAPDRLIADTTHILSQDGSLKVATDADRQMLEDVYKDFASKAYRTLLVAYVDYPAARFLYNPEGAITGDRFRVNVRDDALDRQLITLALYGVEDPVRPEVPDAVAQCLMAGITVRMVTGDVKETAAKIAEQCGILTKKGLCITGAEFRAMTDDQVDRIIPQLQVMARSQPSDKYRLVQRLRALDQIVAVTGDGTNDAPALKAADVGLAMGIAGTDVAKEACDIIIMDDNFRSIVHAVKWGRNVYEGVRKFLQFQLTVNIAALILVFIGAVTRYGAPLRAVQLLWVNLIMDTLAALALATEPPTDKLLLQKPHGKTEPLISNIMWKHILGHMAYQLAATLLILYLAHLIPWTGGSIGLLSRAHYTLVFNTFVWCQLFNEFNCRSIDDHQNIFEGLFKSYIFMAVVIGSAGLQAIIVEFGASAFKVTGLSWDQWLFCIGIGAGSLPLGFILRLIPVPERHFTDILQFWNRPGETRHTTKEVDNYDGMDFELVSAKILPTEEALEENRVAREARKVKDQATRERRAVKIAEFRAAQAAAGHGEK